VNSTLDSREDHFERRQIAKQIVEAKDHIADFIEQRLSLIRSDQDAVHLSGRSFAFRKQVETQVTRAREMDHGQVGLLNAAILREVSANCLDRLMIKIQTVRRNLTCDNEGQRAESSPSS
jgi:hypothetical protein